MAEAPLAVHLWTFGSAGAVLAGGAAFEVVLVRRRRRRGRDDLDALVRAELRGLNTPVSLHPVVDLSVCMGSAACVAACPEGDVLGLVNGHAQLLHGAHCVGHGRCAAECPTGAISLVFGTSKRGVDIPHVSASFESNVPGIFITGELGGMGLIRNAVRQSG
ncbi:MAG: 4Fe-4S dicluster domain-containing protein, partial [Deltaproteobacteria bacterium]|nr:4Fe-4S dicluster domain-containing protein [Deltaproteobacteria bacterium]